MTTTIVALKTLITQYVSACPDMRVPPPAVHKQFSVMGYERLDINMAITALVIEGTVSITEDDFIHITKRERE